MRVRCESNDASRLAAERFEGGFTPVSEFDLVPGNEYVVYGTMLSGSLLSYLIMGEGKSPHWYPAELFNVTQSDLPPNWHFGVFSKEQGYVVNAIWSYEEMINDEEHFDALSDLEPNAVDVFAKRLAEMDND